MRHRTDNAKAGMATAAALVLVALLPLATADHSQSVACGYGPIYSNTPYGFTHRVELTIEVSPDTGYLIECTLGADAYLEFFGEENGVWSYYVTGQLGDYY